MVPMLKNKMMGFLYCQTNELLVNLPDFESSPDLQHAFKNLVLKLLEVPSIEITNLGTEIKALPVNDVQLQIALLSISEQLTSAAMTQELIMNEITANRDNWISRVGVNAMTAVTQSQAIDVETEIALVDVCDIFEIDNYTSRLALYLNIAQTSSEQVRYIS